MSSQATVVGHGTIYGLPFPVGVDPTSRIRLVGTAGRSKIHAPCENRYPACRSNRPPACCVDAPSEKAVFLWVDIGRKIYIFKRALFGTVFVEAAMLIDAGN